jgi:SAP domain-containing ribonucleoprotein
MCFIDRQKLKVTELKELLSKHHLVQSGKKDDLIKRLLDNNVSLEGDDAAEGDLVS